jgi:hypothetical protein
VKWQRVFAQLGDVRCVIALGEEVAQLVPERKARIIEERHLKSIAEGCNSI